MRSSCWLVFVCASSVMGCEKQPTPTVATEPSNSATTVKPTSPSASPSPSSSATSMTAPPPTEVTPMPADAPELARASNQVGFDIYARLKNMPGNLALSPASLSSALAMTYGGAKGETAAQMKTALHFAGDPATTMAHWGQMQRALSSPGQAITLKVANRLFGEKSYTFDPTYLEKTKSAFNAPLEPLDFKGAVEPSRLRINAWVEEQTDKRIKDLLPPGATDPETRLALVNAIYFLADWEESFEKEETKDEPFHLTASKDKKVPTMKATSGHRLAEVAGARVLELNYRTPNYKPATTAMWIVVPDAVDGLAAVEKGLSSASLDEWKAKLKIMQVHVELPRFEVNPKESLSLAEQLKSLGMTEAFVRLKADFTGIASPPEKREQLYISKVFHKAFVKVDEKGTEAAAATAVLMGKGGGAPPTSPRGVIVDRPFLFFIVDKPTNLILFMGRVTDPSPP